MLTRAGGVAALLFWYGCGSAVQQTQEVSSVLPVTIVVSSAQCNLGDRELNGRFLVDEADAAQLLQRVVRPRFGVDAALPNELDFTRQRAVVISLGAKPTPGYGLDVAATAVIDEGVLMLDVTLTSPPPGRMLPQVITTPCVVLALPKDGYQWLALVDKTSRQILLRLPVEHSL